MNKHFQKTLIIIKPDGVQRTLVGEIIKRFEKVGLKIIAMKMLKADEKIIERHYSSDPEWKRKTGEKFIESMKKKGVDIGNVTSEGHGEKNIKSIKEVYDCWSYCCICS